ncbi:CotH kinase family protein, partial [Bacteroidota bacterium]
MTKTKLVLSIFFLTLLISFKGTENNQFPCFNILPGDTILWTTKEAGKIIYSSGNDSIIMNAQIKYRGGVSSKYFKRSFTIKTEKEYPFCDLPGDNDWILNANYIDKTFMRHKISYDLFMEMNSSNIAPLSAFTNVKIDGVYNGLYVLMEKLDATRLG